MIPQPDRTWWSAPEPLPGTPVFAQITGWVGVLIRWAQRLFGKKGARRFAKWTHVGVYLGGGQVLEAMPGGARIAAYNYRPTAWSTIELTDETRSRIVQLARSYVEPVPVPYSFLDYAALFAEKVGAAHLAGWVGDYVEQSGHMICSQLTDHLLTAAGLDVFTDGRRAGSVQPCELAELGILEITSPQWTG